MTETATETATTDPSGTLEATLATLHNELSGCHGVIVASLDGIALRHTLTQGDPQRIAAMAATALSLGRRIAQTIGGGSLSETAVSAAEAQLFLYTVGSRWVLAVVVSAEANVGLVHYKARATAQQLGALLTADPSPRQENPTRS